MFIKGMNRTKKKNCRWRLRDDGELRRTTKLMFLLGS